MIGALFLLLEYTEHTVPSLVVAMEVLAGLRRNKLQDRDPMQLEDIGSVGVIFQAILYYL